jgi:hypothetical protein
VWFLAHKLPKIKHLLARLRFRGILWKKPPISNLLAPTPLQQDGASYSKNLFSRVFLGIDIIILKRSKTVDAL